MKMARVVMANESYCPSAETSLEYKKKLGPASDGAGPNPINLRMFSHIAVRKLD